MAVSIVNYTEVSGAIDLGVRRTIGPISRSKFGPKAALYGRSISAAAVICRMNALDGFGFTRALIFPYDELDFLRSGPWAGMRMPSDPPAGQNALFL